MGLDKFRPDDFKAEGYSQKVFNRIQQIAIQEKVSALDPRRGVTSSRSGGRA